MSNCESSILRIFLEEEASRNLSTPSWIGGAEVDWDSAVAHFKDL